MKWWQKLFGRKRKKVEVSSEDWEEIVYDRDGVDFYDEEQRSRYVVNCLEQMAEASKELDLLTGEYKRVTSYLTDMEEIEALPDEERLEINRFANKLIALEQERARYHEKKERMSEKEYYSMRKQENEVAEAIKKLKESEAYASLIKQDLQRLNGERHAYAYRKAELEAMMANHKGMAVIFLTALGVCVLLLAILQFFFEMSTYIGYVIAIMSAAVALTVVCVKYIDADKEIRKIKRTINKLIQLQNKVKIRYVNNSQLLDYLYMKYDTDSAAKLERLWKNYQEEKEERKQYAEAEAKTEYYQKQLIAQLSRFRVADPGRWINQVSALLDKREMVELRHDLILRRQALRKQMDYNNEVADTAHNEIMDVAAMYPAYAQEILEMVDKYKA
ncbi:MAG: hypothetical protein IJF07_03630 [Lachnospiraceae bacterium]|nr:hypothetical protein [Lachnospiraceae bacterium]